VWGGGGGVLGWGVWVIIRPWRLPGGRTYHFNIYACWGEKESRKARRNDRSQRAIMKGLNRRLGGGGGGVGGGGGGGGAKGEIFVG